MNAPLPPDVFAPRSSASPAKAPGVAPSGAAALPQRYEWVGRFGPMVIEVREQGVYVNGAYVEPASPAGRQPG